MNRHFYLVGAESTGKSTLTFQLAGYYHSPGIREYAREYLMHLGRPYTYHDLELIAGEQLRLIVENEHQPMVFFDTDLINIKVWFQEVYSKVPEWFLTEMESHGKGTYLICQPDIPWEPDPLRENPSRRDHLNELYEKELVLAGFPYFRVTGFGAERFENAVKIVEHVINDSQ